MDPTREAALEAHPELVEAEVARLQAEALAASREAVALLERIRALERKPPHADPVERAHVDAARAEGLATLRRQRVAALERTRELYDAARRVRATDSPAAGL